MPKCRWIRNDPKREMNIFNNSSSLSNPVLLKRWSFSRTKDTLSTNNWILHKHTQNNFQNSSNSFRWKEYNFINNRNQYLWKASKIHIKSFSIWRKALNNLRIFLTYISGSNYLYFTYRRLSFKSFHISTCRNTIYSQF